VLFGQNYLPEGIQNGASVNVAMRPEDVELVEPEGTGDLPAGIVSGVIQTILFVGDRTEYQIKVDDHDRALLFYGTRHQDFVEGGNVWLKLQPATVSVWET